MTPYQLHVNKWKDGCGSDQCPRACNRVFARGTVPSDIVFVGEGPGESEDVHGQPFVGPAGRVMDRIIRRAGIEGKLLYSLYNVVGCMPRDEDGRKGNEPDTDQIDACKPRLEEYLALAKPRLIVCVGNVARDALEQGFKHSIKIPTGTKLVHIKHPAAILKSQTVQQGSDERRCVITIQDAAKAVFNLEG